ncbi:MAG: 2-phosphosulfolactate phosphatase [Ktedonobacterales bacterium]
MTLQHRGDRQALRLDVALAPGLPDGSSPRHDTVFIVVDVIRATTTLCLLFERGCREALIAPDIDTAAAWRARRAGDVLLAGEVAGATPPGFDFGNSPSEFARVALTGRTVIFATTNGTRAISACAGARAIFAGSLRNARAAAETALAAADAESQALSIARDESSGLAQVAAETADDRMPNIVVLCAGRGDRPAYDDTICAGYLVRHLLDAAATAARSVALGEGARIAQAALAGAEAGGGIRAALAQSDAYHAIERIGLAADLDWCAATDVTTVVPRVTGDTSGTELAVMRTS